MILLINCVSSRNYKFPSVIIFIRTMTLLYFSFFFFFFSLNRLDLFSKIFQSLKIKTQHLFEIQKSRRTSGNSKGKTIAGGIFTLEKKNGE